MRSQLYTAEDVGYLSPDRRWARFAERTGFVRLPDGVADAVRERFFFYDWDASVNEVRWMCGFDTTQSDVDAFAALVRDACGAQSGQGAPAVAG